MLKKQLLVIGGGAAGHKIAFDLREHFDVTLIDPKTYWEVPMALPRLLVEPDALPARLPYSGFLAGVRVLQGRAVRMSDRSVTVDAGDPLGEPAATHQVIPFDYAVIATGSRYVDPLIKPEQGTEAERVAQIAAAHQALKQARHVVVAGGGPVGVETAAELRESLSHLDVTLVHGAARLLENGPNRFAGWAAEELTRVGVKLVLDDIVVEPAPGHQPADGQIRTRQGRVLKADVVLWAAGVRPNTEFVRASWPELVQPDGLIKTDHHLRLAGHPNIFVAGDVTNLPEGRLVITASFHVPAIVTSLKTLLASGSPVSARLKPYKPKIPGQGLGKLMVVTLGRRDGLTSLPFGQFRAPFIARNMKSENMFVAKYRKAVGLK